ncbi:MAG: nuclear transport factor 2 family protein [Bacteroidota bacterium]
MTFTSHKDLVRAFYREAIGQRNSELATQIVAEDYIQHHPMLPTGRQGVLDAIEYLKQFPPAPAGTYPVHRMIEDGPLVGVHLWVKLGPRPQLVTDIFRIENGQLAEHWDAIETVPESEGEGLHLIEGAAEPGDRAQTETSRQLISQMYEQVMISQRIPSTALPALGKEASRHPRQQMHRLLVEGQLALVQASGEIEGMAHVFYDWFYLEAGEVRQYWTVKQAVPEKMAHENGMI